MSRDVATTVQDSTAPRFWRDPALPFIEARSIHDGRRIRYARHAHETFSIGTILAGRCGYVNGRASRGIGAGSVVVMNPGDAHACNPSHDERWSYRMFYVDVAWLVEVQRDLGLARNGGFQAFSAIESTHRELYAELNRLYDVLIDPEAEHLEKQSAALECMAVVHHTLSAAECRPQQTNPGLLRAVEFISDNYTRTLKLEEICSAASLSPSYLIRAFKQEYGMTPHAYLVNRRIEFSRAQLRRGRPIAEVALAAGFADQAHLQRSFKKFVAATPGQYRNQACCSCAVDNFFIDMGN
jgi:AraC-like DNA-binding protein